MGSFLEFNDAISQGKRIKTKSECWAVVPGICLTLLSWEMAAAAASPV